MEEANIFINEQSDKVLTIAFLECICCGKNEYLGLQALEGRTGPSNGPQMVKNSKISPKYTFLAYCDQSRSDSIIPQDFGY